MSLKRVLRSLVEGELVVAGQEVEAGKVKRRRLLLSPPSFPTLSSFSSLFLGIPLFLFPSFFLPSSPRRLDNMSIPHGRRAAQHLPPPSHLAFSSSSAHQPINNLPLPTPPRPSYYQNQLHQAPLYLPSGHAHHPQSSVSLHSLPAFPPSHRKEIKDRTRSTSTELTLPPSVFPTSLSRYLHLPRRILDLHRLSNSTQLLIPRSPSSRSV